MNRFFTNKENINDSMVTLDGEDVKHIKNVLRLNKGDKIVVCDGHVWEYTVELESLEDNQINGTIIHKEMSKQEPPIDIILYQSLPKGTKMDLIIQKATELGVKEIIPVITQRTIVKLDNQKKEQKKLERWNRIALEAAKQSKRGRVPTVSNILNFKESLNLLKDEDFVIVPYEDECKIGAKEILKKCKTKRINIVIGSEGGFEEDEVLMLKEIGAYIISLGPRILRTETAGFTAISIALYELGDLGVI